MTNVISWQVNSILMVQCKLHSCNIEGEHNFSPLCLHFLNTEKAKHLHHLDLAAFAGYSLQTSRPFGNLVKLGAAQARSDFLDWPFNPPELSN